MIVVTLFRVGLSALAAESSVIGVFCGWGWRATRGKSCAVGKTPMERNVAADAASLGLCGRLG